MPHHERPQWRSAGHARAPARAFVDWLERTHQRYWQILPVNPTDGFGSPYAGTSVFAGNERLLELGPDELRARMEAFEPDAVYEEFMQANADWLDPYACFVAISELTGTDEWQTWPAEWRRWTPELLRDPRLADGIRFHRFAQWGVRVGVDGPARLRQRRGIRIIGDIPMYVAASSADVWTAPEQFCVDADGRPTLQAGTPPDAFAKDGQLWGNPCYRWDAMRADGYAWWMRRLARTFSLYDVTRLDHFLGFQNYYGVPSGCTALEGSWHAGPGISLFRRAHELLGQLPIIAEDLGSVTPATRSLLAQVGCCGMDVMQFADNDVREGWAPRQDKVAYTSTHDNQTLVGWCGQRFGLEPDAARELAGRLMRAAFGSGAGVVMCTLQDAALLGDEARMNVPGVAEGNWTWQATEADLAAGRGAPRRACALNKSRGEVACSSIESPVSCSAPPSYFRLSQSCAPATTPRWPSPRAPARSCLRASGARPAAVPVRRLGRGGRRASGPRARGVARQGRGASLSRAPRPAVEERRAGRRRHRRPYRGHRKACDR